MNEYFLMPMLSLFAFSCTARGERYDMIWPSRSRSRSRTRHASDCTVPYCTKRIAMDWLPSTYHAMSASRVAKVPACHAMPAGPGACACRAVRSAPRPQLSGVLPLP